MKRFTLGILLILAISIVGAHSVSAQFFELDPKLEWQILTTEHFWVVYHEGLEELAQDTATFSEEAWEIWSHKLNFRPTFRMNIIVADLGDLPAGAANPLSHDTIQGISIARGYNEWLNSRTDSKLRAVVYHEIGHVFDLAKVAGVPAFLSKIFGSIATSNLARPGTIVEGIPIYEELNQSGESRANDPREGMYLRAMLLEEDFILHDVMSTSYSRAEFPSPYMLNHNYGAWLTRYMAESYGDETITEITEVNSRRVIPTLTLLLNDWGSLLKRATGDTPADFYAGFQDWVLELYADDILRIESEGVTQSKVISPNTYWNNKPEYSPNGEWIAYFQYDQKRDGSVRLIKADGTEDHALFPALLDLPFFRPPFWAPAPKFSSDGSQLIYQKNEYHKRFPIYGDIYIFDLDTNRERKMTDGIRAYNPIFTPDGNSVIFARQHSNGKSPTLEMLDLNTEEVRVLKDFESDMLIDTFELSPDGSQLVLSSWHRGFQDIYLMPAAGGELTHVTQDAATDTDPSWSPDGQYILFSSDRGEFNNLYAYQLSNRAFFRVTNMLTGAFAPDVSPSANELAFVGYSTAGYELHTMAYDPSSWVSVSIQQEQLPGKMEVQPITEAFESYNPLRFLVPKFWLPIPGIGGQLGGFTAGNDPLNQHQYSILGGWDMANQRPFFNINYINSQFNLPITIDLGADDESMSQSVSIALPLLKHLQETQTFTLGVGRNAPYDPELSEKLLLTSSWVWTKNSGLDLFKSQRTVTARGELGFLAELDAPQMKTDLEWREILRLPLESTHHLALKFAAGMSDGVEFSLGGSGGTYGLRGYSAAAVTGLKAIAASVELRSRLISVERGLGLLPLFVDDIDIALFTDFGIAGDTFAMEPDSVKIGLGAELQTTFTIGYRLSDVRLSLGFAKALELDQPDIYVRFGTAF
jgi:Tol biopolymer transport system component